MPFQKGNKLSGFKGKKHTKESKKRISDNLKGINRGEQSKEHKDKLRLAKIGKTGKESNAYKEDVGYRAIHLWVETKMGKANACSICFVRGLKRYHWANISLEYKRDIKDWIQLCPKCHWKFDNDKDFRKDVLY